MYWDTGTPLLGLWVGHWLSADTPMKFVIKENIDMNLINLFWRLNNEQAINANMIILRYCIKSVSHTSLTMALDVVIPPYLGKIWTYLS